MKTTQSLHYITDRRTHTHAHTSTLIRSVFISLAYSIFVSVSLAYTHSLHTHTLFYLHIGTDKYTQIDTHKHSFCLLSEYLSSCFFPSLSHTCSYRYTNTHTPGTGVYFWNKVRSCLWNVFSTVLSTSQSDSTEGVMCWKTPPVIGGWAVSSAGSWHLGEWHIELYHDQNLFSRPVWQTGSNLSWCHWHRGILTVYSQTLCVYQ